jgi:hypothetical protein
MKVEFPEGISEQCIEWLLENVGSGNVYRSPLDGRICIKAMSESDAWFFERVFANGIATIAATITVKDEKMATWFILRWS